MTRVLICAAAVLIVALPAGVLAQPGDKYEMEFALLASINWIQETRECYYENCPADRDRSYLTVPNIAPGLRLTVWGARPVLIDFGITLFEEDEGSRFDPDGQALLESGISIDFAKRGKKLRPFGGAIIGAVSGDGDAKMYLGAQGGIRYFIRDYAATRAQLAYRKTVGDDPPKLRAIELACGLSFFL